MPSSVKFGSRPENFFDALEFFRRQAMFRHEFGSDSGIGHRESAAYECGRRAQSRNEFRSRACLLSWRNGSLDARKRAPRR